MSLKSIGTAAERELVHLFWNHSWCAARVAGSGSMRYPSPDIIAANNIRKLVLECKATKSTRQYLTKKEISELREFADRFGAEAWVAVKFARLSWYFLNIEDLNNSEKGHSINIEQSKRRGLLFEELIH